MEIKFVVGSALVVGLLIGAIITWLYAKLKSSLKIAELENKYNEAFIKLESSNTMLTELKSELTTNQLENINLSKKLMEVEVKLSAAERELFTTLDKTKLLEDQLEIRTTDFLMKSNDLATYTANYEALLEKYSSQKQELEQLNEKFKIEFENLANRILEEKTEKFTLSNKETIESLLKPLGENIDKFKAKVEEVYDKESKERFSLGERVKELAQLNQVISEEAKNLTRALKGEAKTQGRWGEMILESILEKSGLVKGREYFMEHQLLDNENNPIKSQTEGKKMRPDAVINYPDQRSVIIDAKVSLNAFTRYLEATDPEIQKMELAAHVSAVKSHITSLSAKGYDDYNKALDFVMLFIPSEPAYIAAMQGDPDLWNFAYDKRILLLNPTNLITSLKLIVDLWKREYQNQNSLEIAERGAKLYDKFVGFVENLKIVGDHLAKAQNKYDDAYKQLSIGNDNLMLQATKLKELGVKSKKQLPGEL